MIFQIFEIIIQLLRFYEQLVGQSIIWNFNVQKTR